MKSHGSIVLFIPVLDCNCSVNCAADKNHSGAAWGFAGLLFGPIALIATFGLADRRQHQLLRRIADALSGEISSDGGTRQNECLNGSSDTISPPFCSLHGNDLGEVGGTAIAKALETNTSLQNLE